MEISDVIQLISNVGFPICVAGYSLTRLERTMKDNTEIMKEVLIKLKEEK